MDAAYYRNHAIRSLRLSASDAELSAKFALMSSERDLATLLDVTPQQLAYWTRFAPDAQRYRSFELVKKTGGKREIHAPIGPLRVLLGKLLQALSSVYTPRVPVHGFVRTRSIVTNASPHVGTSWVLNVDIEDFFPSINFGRVVGIFQAKPFSLSREVALAIARLTTFHGKLPQGSPTSPIISNVVSAKMDGELRRMAHQHRATYTRYADDITFSVRGRRFPAGLATLRELEHSAFSAELSEELKKVIVGNGFAPKDSKTRIQPWKRSQRVTGLVVNRKTNVTRAFVRRTRAMLHAWERFGLDAAEAEHKAKYAVNFKSGRTPSLKGRVRGCIAHIGQVKGRDNSIYMKLLRKYKALSGDPEVTVDNVVTDDTNRRDVFICHASEDKKTVVEPLEQAIREAGMTVWFDKAEIKWGESITAKVNEGLSISRYVLVVISPAVLSKNWPQRELMAALNREIGGGTVSVLTLMVGDDEHVVEFQRKYPLQADKLFMRWTGEVDVIVRALRSRVGLTEAK